MSYSGSTPARLIFNPRINHRVRLRRFTVEPVPVGLVIAAQSVVDQQSHHVTLPGALLEGPAGLALLGGLGAGGARDDVFAGWAVVLTPGRRGCPELGAGAQAGQLPRLLLRCLQHEALVVADGAVCAAQRGLCARILAVDLPQHHQAQGDQPALGLALLRRWKVHAHFGWVHNPGAALLRPDWHEGGHGGGLGRDPLEGEDLGLRAAGRHPGEGEALPLHSQSHAVGPTESISVLQASVH